MPIKFKALAEAHRPVIAELTGGKFTRIELASLAVRLPFDPAAWGALKPTVEGASVLAFRRWLEFPGTSAGEIAVYVAAAAHATASKILLEVEALRIQERTRLEELRALLGLAIDRDTPTLLDAMKYGYAPEAEGPTDGTPQVD